MLGYYSGFGNDMFDELERMRRQMEQAVGGGWPGSASIRSPVAGAFPGVNVGAAADRVEVYVFAPGVDPKSLDLNIQQNLLTISGERSGDLPADGEVYRNERFAGNFRRVLSLPDDVDPDKVTATCRDGVLHVRVERREAVRPRQIEVR
jgi:HSP20 family protein